MEHFEWNTLTGWISAIGSVAAVVVGLAGLKSQKQTRLEMSEREASGRWSLALRRQVSGQLLAEIDYSQEGPAIRWLKIEAVAPRGMTLQTYRIIRPENPTEAVRRLVIQAADKGPSRILDIDRDTNERTIGGCSQSFLVHLPPRHFWERPQIRIRVRVRYEDRDAARTEREIVVSSAEIDRELASPSS